jgi:glycosyltransferase involved in cell wall biosynthesis
MPTIALDATYTVDPEPSGVAVYSRRLIESLLELETRHRFLVCYRLSRFRRRRQFLRPSANRKFGRRLIQEPLTFWLPWQAELFHSLAQRPPAFRFRKEVVTVFDLFPISGENYSTPEFRRRFSALLAEAVRRAARIITLSEYTAGELRRRLGADEERIRVIPPGVDLPSELATAGERLHERERWVGRGNELVLMVGAIQNRKNTLGAVKAMTLLPSRYRLILAGGSGYGSEAVHEFIHQESLTPRVITPGYVAPDQLESLYKAASVFLFPSLEEGFGLPVLEAMARGVPVVTSRTSSLPEAGGDAVLYVDPRSVEEIAGRVKELVEDDALRSELVSRGIDRVSQFSWRRAAGQTLDVYDEVLFGKKEAAARWGGAHRER